MDELLRTIKEVVNAFLDGYGLCDLSYGVVLSAAPLRVRLSDRIVLEEDQLLLTQQVVRKTVDCSHQHATDESVGLPEPVVIFDGLQSGDRILMLRVRRGSKYIILSKEVKNDTSK